MHRRRCNAPAHAASVSNTRDGESAKKGWVISCSFPPYGQTTLSHNKLYKNIIPSVTSRTHITRRDGPDTHVNAAARSSSSVRPTLISPINRERPTCNKRTDGPDGLCNATSHEKRGFARICLSVSSYAEKMCRHCKARKIDNEAEFLNSIFDPDLRRLGSGKSNKHEDMSSM